MKVSRIMKTSIKTLFLTAAVIVFTCTAAFAQPRNGREGWQQRMMSEKIAFITAELSLTPQEAQTFWPIYNACQKEKQQANEKVFKTYGELMKATAEKKPEAECKKLVDEYVKALEATNGIDARYVTKYMKVLSAQRLAKLFVAEEDFRRVQFNKIGDHQRGPANSGK